MLRRPRVWLSERLGEGCSSTASGYTVITVYPVWGNPANRGSGYTVITVYPAVP